MTLENFIELMTKDNSRVNKKSIMKLKELCEIKIVAPIANTEERRGAKKETGLKPFSLVSLSEGFFSFSSEKITIPSVAKADSQRDISKAE